MASFRVGQRVRVVAACEPRRQDVIDFVGLCGVVVDNHPTTMWWPIAVDFPSGVYGIFHQSELAPLTDPDSEWADNKIAALKKLTDRKIVTTREGVYELAGGESKRISALTK